MSKLQHPLPDKLLLHIGDFVVSFALLESSLQTLIGSLIAEHQRVGQIITAELPFKGLRALLISLYKERHGEDADYKTLRSLVKKAAETEAIRNQLMHSIWGAGENDTVTRIKSTAKEKHGMRFSFENVSESELKTHVESVKTLAASIQAFWTHLLKSGKAVNNSSKKHWGTDVEA